jgi:hypothetical protein
MTTLQQVFKQLKIEKKRAEKEVERLEEAISAFGKLVGGSVWRLGRAAAGRPAAGRHRRKMSAAARKRISQAQKMRWAKLKGR